MLAVFDGGETFFSALIELLQAAIGPSQIVIVAKAKTLSGLLRPQTDGTTEHRDALAVIDNVEAATTATETETETDVVVSRSSIWLHAPSLDRTSAVALFAASWLSPALRAGLTRHVHNGAIVLGVRSESVAQQRQSTRTLLKHSSHQVQTHEFIE